MNSREKGKRGERLWRDELRAQGYHARRGQQFAGGADSPDVICDELSWIHFEVKAVERLNIEDAMDQARRDTGQKSEDGGQSPDLKVPMVAHKRRHRRWLVTMDGETFFQFLSGTLPPQEARSAECGAGKSRNWESRKLKAEIGNLESGMVTAPQAIAGGG